MRKYRPDIEYGKIYDPKALERSLSLIQKAVQGEKTDELFYEYLMGLAPTKEEKNIIASIRDDERKHYKMFKKIYKDFTGKDISRTNEEPFQKPKSYVEGIKKALFGELRAIEMYREIREGLPTKVYRDMLFEIITDEIKHSAKYNYLFTLNMTTANHPNVQNSEPKQWQKYIEPLIKEGLEEAEETLDLEQVFQKFIFSGVLVGQGYTAEEALEKVKENG